MYWIASVTGYQILPDIGYQILDIFHIVIEQIQLYTSTVYNGDFWRSAILQTIGQIYIQNIKIPDNGAHRITDSRYRISSCRIAGTPLVPRRLSHGF